MVDIEFKLYFYENNQLLKKVAIKKHQYNSWLVGSSEDAHIRLDNSRISKQHLQIIYNNDGALYVNDLNSTNGTFLNGLKINDSHQLKHKDKLQLSGVNDVLIHVEKSYSQDVEYTNNAIIDKLKSSNKVTIGRGVDCDIVINHSTVSKFHAAITKLSEKTYLLEDQDSTNGTYVNGRKISKSVEINLNDKIFIGRHQLTLEGKVKDLNEELAIAAIGIEKTYSNGVKALKRMDLSITSKSIIAIMGPSGCGKSTLLKALNGDTPPSKGKIFLFNQELSTNWEYLKTQIGYVPQDDIIHKQLTVSQCLYYTAKLRLENLSNEEIEDKIIQVLTDLKMVDKKDHLISNLSGGQRKRVSIAVELMTDPLILFLDEPTSPLDPQTVDDFLGIMKNLSKKGTTVLMVTHKPEDLEYMDDVIFMAEGGHIVFYGDSKKYKEYFNVKTSVSVFSQISGDSAQVWIDKYLNPRPPGNTSDSFRFNKTSETSYLKQFYWLTSRYFTIKTNDKVNTLLMLSQAPIIAILICLIFQEISSAVLFMMAISAIWLGAQNAAREIVSEGAIYKRERMFNLEILPYILSKISVLTVFSFIQSFIFIFILFLHFSSSPISLHDPFSLFIWMFVLSIASTFLGLLLSSLVKTTERAMTILPLILIPQIMLAGLITKVNNVFVEFISYFTISRWGVEGFSIIQEKIIEDISIGLYEISSQEMDALNFMLDRFYESYRNKDIFGNLTATLNLDIFIILLMIIVLTLLIYRNLKNMDSIKIDKK
tara:strand:- start:2314 stop:4608 length:2295 start_codon:yes stop_codon:yes gene_type:complete